MKLAENWNRMMQQPAPRRPVRQLVQTTAWGFFFGLILGQFIPIPTAPGDLPIRIDLPFRTGAFSGFGAFVGIGALLLAPAARKALIILVLASIPAFLALYVLLLRTISKFDFERFERGFPVAAAIGYGLVGIIFFTACCGWVRYFKEVERKKKSATAELFR